MDDRSIRHVLGILRLLKAEKGNATAIKYITRWSRTDDPSVILRVASYIQQEIENATVVIGNSQLVAEAKSGLSSLLARLRAAFSLGNLASDPKGHIKDVDGAIANLVILLSVLSTTETEKTPEQATDLIGEIEELIASFDDEKIDPLVRDVARRHLKALSTLLQLIPIFGIEAAMSAYFDLVMQLRRSTSGTGTDSDEKVKPLLKRIEKWAERITGLAKILDASSEAIGFAGHARELLAYIPPLG